MPKIHPCLWFDTQAEQAAQYYVGIFPNSAVTHVQYYGTAGPGPAGSVLLVQFSLDGQPYTALNGGQMAWTFNESISFMVHCETQKEVDAYWDKLTSGGGEESMCGWLKDKYGISWQIIPNALLRLQADKDRAKANRVMQAMLKMRKIDIPALERAAAG